MRISFNRAKSLWKPLRSFSSVDPTPPHHDRLMYFDPDFLATLPRPLRFYEPVVEYTKDIIVTFQEATGVPWVIVIPMASLVIRTLILPVFYIQMKKTSQFAELVPAAMQLKEIYIKSNLPKKRKIFLIARIMRYIIKFD